MFMQDHPVVFEAKTPLELAELRSELPLFTERAQLLIELIDVLDVSLVESPVLADLLLSDALKFRRTDFLFCLVFKVHRASSFRDSLIVRQPSVVSYGRAVIISWSERKK